MIRKSSGSDWAKNLVATVIASVVVYLIQNCIGPSLTGLTSHSERAPAADPQTVKAEACRFYERALECGQRGRFSDAVADYTESLRLDPSFAPAYLNRARAFGQMGQLDRMVADCTEAISLEPACALAYASRGWAYAKLGRYDRAADDSTEALRLDANLTEASAIRSWALANQTTATTATAWRP
jgi:tetratricopeptide (TPR) repeat protein